MDEHNIPPWTLTRGERAELRCRWRQRWGWGPETHLPSADGAARVQTHASPACRVQGLIQGGAVGLCNTLFCRREKRSMELLNSLSRGWSISPHLLNREDLFFKQTALCTGPSPPAGGCWRRHRRPASRGQRAFLPDLSRGTVLLWQPPALQAAEENRPINYPSRQIGECDKRRNKNIPYLVQFLVKLVFRAQHGVQGCGDMRQPFVGRSAKAVKQAQAGSLASVSQGGSASGIRGRQPRQQDGVTSLGAQRRSWPRQSLLCPSWNFRVTRGPGVGAGRLRGELASRVVEGPAWPGSPGTHSGQRSSGPSPSALTLRRPLKPGAGAALGGRAHPCLPLRLVLWSAQSTGGWVPCTTPSPGVQATLTLGRWWRKPRPAEALGKPRDAESEKQLCVYTAQGIQLVVAALDDS